MHLRAHEEELSPALVLVCAICNRAFRDHVDAQVSLAEGNFALPGTVALSSSSIIEGFNVSLTVAGTRVCIVFCGVIKNTTMTINLGARYEIIRMYRRVHQ